MLEYGFIFMHRSITKWEWYKNKETHLLFTHFLYTVNYKPENWQGIIINRGQRICSYQSLSDETGLSIKEIRTAIKHLNRSGEVAYRTTSKYGMVTVNNYNKYQTMAHEAAVEGQSRGNNVIKRNNTNNIKKENFSFDNSSKQSVLDRIDKLSAIKKL